MVIWVLWPPLIVLYARFYVDCVAAGCSALCCQLVFDVLAVVAVGHSDCPGAAAAAAAALVCCF